MYIAPGSSLYKISEDVSAEAAILTAAVLGNGLRWIQSGARSIYGQPVTVLGPGPQGLAVTIAASEAGASPIIVTGIKGDETRLELAKKCGADITINISELDGDLKDEIESQLGGRLPTTVVDVTGTVPGVQTAVDLVEREGTAVIASLMGEDSKVPLEIDEFRRKDAWIKGVFSHRASNVEHSTKVIERDEYPFEDMVTSVFELENSEEAIRTVMGETNQDRENIKVAIRL
jgi:threonine dehydrogenase-like Zn-dependent dehydrogenase